MNVGRNYFYLYENESFTGGTGMTYQVLYRAWRPQNFSELVGQEPIRRTLENALRQGRISHAYLFAGPRGTGKTSTARILAMALNCANPRDGQPCEECESCRAIQRGNSMDVLEIDAASNRGIEEIRDLKEKMGFMPVLGKYKVYIVDEVHMLTTEAFNALLKTLEEPPAHVVFILATTDVQKLPATILSRCQRFDFRKIAPAVIKKRLKEIVESLQIPVEEEVYGLIIKRADGGLRDAISLLDQCLAFSPEGLDKETAYDVLGLIHQEALQQLTQAIIDEDAGNLYLLIDKLVSDGVEPFQILRDLIEYYRNLIMLLVCGQDTELVLAGEEERKTMQRQAQVLGMEKLQSMIVALETMYMAKMRGNGRYMVEVILTGFINGSTLAGTEPPFLPNGVGARGASALASSAAVAKKPAAFVATDAALMASAAATTSTASSVSPVSAPAPTVTAAGAAGSTFVAGLATERQGTVNQASAPPTARPSVRCSVTNGLSSETWEKILQMTKGQRIVLHAFLTASVEQRLEDDTLTVLFDPEKGRFHKERSEEAENRRILQEVAAQVLGQAVKVEYGFKEENLDQDPVKKAIAIFGEEIVEIKK